MTTFAAALLALLASGLPAAAAQDQDAAALKERILKKVREKLAAERVQLLQRIGKIIDEELEKTPAEPAPGERLSQLERNLRLLEAQKETILERIEREKRLAADEPLRAEAKKNGPHDGEEAQEMFENALELHDKEKNFRESTRLFKRIYYNFPRTRIAAISAYNVACGFALAGQKVEALDWLELSVEGGYNDFDHLRKDADLDSLRNEKRYRKLLTDR
jgi:hypothetical protein